MWRRRHRPRWSSCKRPQAEATRSRPAKLRRIAARGNDRKDRLARLRGVGRGAIGGRGDEAERARAGGTALERRRIVARRRGPDHEVGRLSERRVDGAVGTLRRQQVFERSGRPVGIGEGGRVDGGSHRCGTERGGEEGRQYRAGDDQSSHLSSGGIARLPEGTSPPEASHPIRAGG